MREHFINWSAEPSLSLESVEDVIREGDHRYPSQGPEIENACRWFLWIHPFADKQRNMIDSI